MFWQDIIFKNKKNQGSNKSIEKAGEQGIVIFDRVEEAIKAEKIIKKEGQECKLLAPPPALRKGCDLALGINLVEQPLIERILADKVVHKGMYPLQGSAELLDIVKITYFKEYTMVKAGNMKITFQNDNGIIVNTSGGGCPDIPYLNLQMVGKELHQVPRPREVGSTLCAVMLDRALEESLAIWKEEK